MGVQLNLSKLPGVEKCDVSAKQKKAVIVMAPGAEPDLERIKAAVVEAGFTPGNAVIK